jgi:hypothetical protein
MRLAILVPRPANSDKRGALPVSHRQSLSTTSYSTVRPVLRVAHVAIGDPHKLGQASVCSPFCQGLNGRVPESARANAA